MPWQFVSHSTAVAMAWCQLAIGAAVIVDWLRA